MDNELIEGRLCEKGFMKERYDEKTQDLVRTVTPKGKAYVKNLLKTNLHSKKMFFQLIKENLRRLPPELHEKFIIEVKKQLK